MRLSYLGKLPLFFTLGIDMRQFLLGTVQRITFERNCSVLRITKRQFLLGTVQRKMRRTRNLSNKECQFLLGTVLQVILHVNPEELEAEYVSIPLRYGTTSYYYSCA